MEKVKNFFYYFIIGVLIIYVLILAISPEDMMDLIGFRTFIVLSDSMDPTIQKDDLIIVRDIAESELEVGDIITFYVYIDEQGSRSYVTHYIHEIDTTGDVPRYTTIGENREEDEYDHWVDAFGNEIKLTFYDIEGEYVFRVPYVGYLQRAFSNRIFMGLILLNGIVIYFTVRYIRKG